MDARISKKFTKGGKSAFRKMMSLCLAVALIVGLMPMMASPAYAAAPPQLQVYDTTAGAWKTYNLGTDTLPAGLSWDSANSRLEMNGYSGDSIKFAETGTTCNLYITGINTIISGGLFEAIYSKSPLNIDGTETGTLSLQTSHFRAVYVVGDITVKNIHMNIDVNSPNNLNAARSIDASNLKLTGSAKLKAKVGIKHSEGRSVIGVNCNVYLNDTASIQVQVQNENTTTDTIGMSCLFLNGTGDAIISLVNKKQSLGGSEYKQAVKENDPMALPSTNFSGYTVYGDRTGEWVVYTRATGKIQTPIVITPQDLPVPVAGQRPVWAFEKDNYLAAVDWIDVSTGKKVKDQFALGGTYKAAVTVLPKFGHNLEDLNNASYDTSLYGSAITVVGVSGTKNNQIALSFQEPTVADPLSFPDEDKFDIPAGDEKTPITPVLVEANGGKKPYTYSKVSGPDWLKVETMGPLGKISGTRPFGSSTATTAKLQVVDAAGTKRFIEINVGTVTQVPRVVTDVKLFLNGKDATDTYVKVPASGQTTLTYTAKVYSQFEDEVMASEGVNWSLAPASTGVSMTNGTVTIDHTATTGSAITLTAASQTDNNKKASVLISLTEKISPTIFYKLFPSYDYTGTPLAASELTEWFASFDGDDEVPGVFSFITPPDSFVNAGKHSVTIQFTPTDTTKYETMKITVPFTVNKVMPTGTPAYTAITQSGKTLADAELTVGSITPAGTITWNDAATTVVAANTAYGWIFTPKDVVNYNKLTGSITPYVVSSSGGGGGSSSGSSSGGGSSAPAVTAKPVEISKAIKNGTVESNLKEAKPGDTVNITPKADADYELKAIKVTDKNGKSIDVSKNIDGTFSFKMPDTSVTIEAEFVPLAALIPTQPIISFQDVAADAWYAPAIAYVVQHGLMVGTSPDQFSPDMQTTRGMIVTILYHLAKSPAVNDGSPFHDVTADKWYADAVAWAAANHIIAGYPDGSFKPNQVLTREQLVTILYQYSRMKGYDTTGSELSAFNDANQISGYALSAMQWAVKHGIVSGMGDSALSPRETATRAQMATILQRYVEKFVK